VKTLLPHAAPYAVYVAIGAAGEHLAPYTDAIRVALVGAMLVAWTRRGAYPELRTGPSAAQTLIGIAAGLAVGVAWVPLAKLVPSLGPTERTGLDPDAGAMFVALRAVDMCLVVPFAEELFMRSAIPRFVDARRDEDWRALPIGVFTRASAAVSVVFFTLMHPEWLAGLATGVLWTVILAKTRNLRVLVVSHAVANAWVAGHVLVTHEKQWW
jgi:CAAX prenyl protease-like protein